LMAIEFHYHHSMVIKLSPPFDGDWNMIIYVWSLILWCVFFLLHSSSFYFFFTPSLLLFIKKFPPFPS
jgi:hypothetical protein